MDGTVRHLVVAPVLPSLQEEHDAALDLPSFRSIGVSPVLRV
jgi:hypothetical protein